MINIDSLKELANLRFDDRDRQAVFIFSLRNDFGKRLTNGMIITLIRSLLEVSSSIFSATDFTITAFDPTHRNNQNSPKQTSPFDANLKSLGQVIDSLVPEFNIDEIVINGLTRVRRNSSIHEIPKLSNLKLMLAQPDMMLFVWSLYHRGWLERKENASYDAKNMEELEKVLDPVNSNAFAKILTDIKLRFSTKVQGGGDYQDNFEEMFLQYARRTVELGQND